MCQKRCTCGKQGWSKMFCFLSPLPHDKQRDSRRLSQYIVMLCKSNPSSSAVPNKTQICDRFSRSLLLLVAELLLIYCAKIIIRGAF